MKYYKSQLIVGATNERSVLDAPVITVDGGTSLMNSDFPLDVQLGSVK